MRERGEGVHLLFVLRAVSRLHRDGDVGRSGAAAALEALEVPGTRNTLLKALQRILRFSSSAPDLFVQLYVVPTQVPDLRLKQVDLLSLARGLLFQLIVPLLKSASGTNVF